MFSLKLATMFCRIHERMLYIVSRPARISHASKSSSLASFLTAMPANVCEISQLLARCVMLYASDRRSKKNRIKLKSDFHDALVSSRSWSRTQSHFSCRSSLRDMLSSTRRNRKRRSSQRREHAWVSLLMNSEVVKKKVEKIVVKLFVSGISHSRSKTVWNG